MRFSICCMAGGDEGTRTPDPLLAKQTLFQLSYIPNFLICSRLILRSAKLVGPSGIEPETSALSARRSNQLSYEPEFRHALRR